MQDDPTEIFKFNRWLGIGLLPHDCAVSSLRPLGCPRNVMSNEIYQPSQNCPRYNNHPNFGIYTNHPNIGIYTLGWLINIYTNHPNIYIYMYIYQPSQFSGIIQELSCLRHWALRRTGWRAAAAWGAGARRPTAIPIHRGSKAAETSHFPWYSRH